jgi:hypothetical protein
MMWNPETLVSEVPQWLGGGTGLRIGIDAMSPGGRALIEAALPGCIIVDGTRLLAEVMLAKSPEEVKTLGELCLMVTAAAEEGLKGGRTALLRALNGAFTVAYPRVSDRRVQVAIRREGMIAEARLGPGDAARGERALQTLRTGSSAGEVAASLPPAVEVTGIGWGYEAPLMRDGWATPDDLVLEPGAVLAVRWDACGVTVALDDTGTRLLSRSPEEVAR